MKRKANLSSLVYHGLLKGAGEKGGKAKIKRRRATVPDAVHNLPVVDRLKQRHHPTLTQLTTSKPTSSLNTEITVTSTPMSSAPSTRSTSSSVPAQFLLRML